MPTNLPSSLSLLVKCDLESTRNSPSSVPLQSSPRSGEWGRDGRTRGDNTDGVRLSELSHRTVEFRSPRTRPLLTRTRGRVSRCRGPAEVESENRDVWPMLEDRYAGGGSRCPLLTLGTPSGFSGTLGSREKSLSGLSVPLQDRRPSGDRLTHYVRPRRDPPRRKC